MKNKVLFIAFFLIILSLANYGQTIKLDSLKSIKINVIDSVSDAPLENCTLIITDKNLNNLFIGVSNASGQIEFKIDIKKALKYKFVLIGYKVKERNLNFDNRVEATIGIVTSVTMLNEVKISGATIIRDADKLTYKVNDKKFLKGAIAVDVLRDVPLVNVTGDGSIEVKNSKTIIMVDGKSTNSAMLQNITADRIVSVDVIVNPSVSNSAANGSSILNIKLKKSDIPQYNGNVGMVLGLRRELYFPGAYFNISNKKLYASFYGSLRSSLQQSGNSQKRINLNTNEFLTESSSTGEMKLKTQNFSTDIYYDISKKDRVYLGLSYSKMDVSFSGVGSDFFYADGSTVNNNNSNLSPDKDLKIEAEYKREITKKSNIIFDYVISLSRGKKQVDYSIISNPANYITSLSLDNLKTNTNIFQAVYNNSFANNKLKAEIGANYRQITSSDNFMSILQSSNYNVQEFNLTQLKQNALSSFLTLKYSIKGYSLRGGVRYENLKQNNLVSTDYYAKNYNNFFPNFVIQKEINSKISLLFNYQRKITRPNISILNPNRINYSILESYQGNINLQPELLNKYDINFDYKTKKSFYELTFYTNYTKNPIVYISEQSGQLINNVYRNSKSLFVYGSSISIKTDFNDYFSLNAFLFAENYDYDKIYMQTAYREGYNFGGNLNLYYRIPKLFALNLNTNYKRIPLFTFQSFYQRYAPDMSLSISKNILKEKLRISLAYNDIFNNLSNYTFFYNDTNTAQIRKNNGQTSNVLLNISYLFGKQIFSTKSKTGIVKDGDKSFQKL